jgi:hypothetical protein
MAINRELSQFAPFVSVNDSNRNVGIATTTLPNIGIGTPVPNAKFEVIGDTKLETLNVSGVSTLASAGGITTTGGDLYIGGDLYVLDDLNSDEFNARNGNITGVGTITTLNSSNTTITDLVGTAATITTLDNTSFTGVEGTITSLDSTDFVSTAGTITTLNSSNTTITDLVGTAATITTLSNVDFDSVRSDITFLNVGTAATIAALDVTGLAEIDSLSILGVSTFNSDIDVKATAIVDALTVFPGPTNISGATTFFSAVTLASSGGITTTGGDLYVGGDLYIADDAVFDELNARNINISGIGTVDFLEGTNISYSGIGTIETLDTTTGTIDYLTNTNLNVSGVTTLASSGGITTTGGDFYGGNNASFVGVITAAGFEGGPLSGSDGSFTNLDVSGIGTIANLEVSTDLDVYATTSTFTNDIVVQGNLTVYGTETIVNTQSLNILDKDIILGIGTTPGNETDDTANGGGVAIASTEGSPLICLQCGVNTFPGTYKQLLWLKEGTFAGLATDTWISNYAVSIASTIIDNGSRLAVGNIQLTDDDIKAVRHINASGIATFSSGLLFVGTGSSTGTADQKLQIDGGAYISGNLGIGTTNPQAGLSIHGKIVVGNSVDNPNISNTLNYASGSGIDAFRSYNLIDSSAGIKISRNDGLGNGATVELQTWDVGIQTNYSYWDFTAEDGYFGIRDRNAGYTRLFIDDSGSVLLGANDSSFTDNYTQLVDIGTDKVLSVVGKTYISDNTGIGSTNPTSKLYVVGDAYVTGVTTSTDFNSASDINLKENIQPIINPIDKVLQINGVSFDWKDNGRSSMGVIAQEVERVLPELVNGTDSKTVNYNGLIGLLIEVVKEQQQRINTLEEKVK